jgi:DNA topoisomerase-3
MLTTPCPNCGGTVMENYRRYACIGKPANSSVDHRTDGAPPCGFSFTKTPAGRTFSVSEAETLLRERRLGPLEGFRSKAGWPFVAELTLVRDEEAGNFKLEFDFGEDAKAEESGELVDLSAEPSLGPCPKCGAAVKPWGKNYVCERAVPTAEQPTPSCDFKSGKVILQQSVEPEQMQKLLATGKTDELDKFVSMRTRRAFKAMLAWSAEEGKVVFEFAPRPNSKYPPRKTAAAKAPAKSAAKTAGKTAGKTVAKATKTAAKKTTAASDKPKAPRKVANPLTPSAELAAVIGNEPVGRTEVVKKLWDYIKAHNLQDPKDKRTIRADDKLRPVFGKDAVGMFELAGLVGKHLG